jgi:hypothetical protein
VAFISWPASATLMPDYRAYLVGADGHFVGFEPLVCANDGEAVKRAERLTDRHPVELWSGATLVVRLSGPQIGAVTHEICEGRMVSKLAT